MDWLRMPDIDRIAVKSAAGEGACGYVILGSTSDRPGEGAGAYPF